MILAVSVFGFGIVLYKCSNQICLLANNHWQLLKNTNGWTILLGLFDLPCFLTLTPISKPIILWIPVKMINLWKLIDFPQVSLSIKCHAYTDNISFVRFSASGPSLHSLFLFYSVCRCTLRSFYNLSKVLKNSQYSHMFLGLE